MQRVTKNDAAPRRATRGQRAENDARARSIFYPQYSPKRRIVQALTRAPIARALRRGMMGAAWLLVDRQPVLADRLAGLALRWECYT